MVQINMYSLKFKYDLQAERYINVQCTAWQNFVHVCMLSQPPSQSNYCSEPLPICSFLVSNSSEGSHPVDKLGAFIHMHAAFVMFHNMIKMYFAYLLIC